MRKIKLFQSQSQAFHKTALKVIMIICCLLTGVTLNAQDIVVSGASGSFPCSDVNGAYNYASDVNGKPRYTGSFTSIIWDSSSSEWLILEGGSAIKLYSNPSDTPIPPTSGWISGSSCSGTLELSGAIYVSNVSDVPTLSEWGLIILALLLMTFGVLYQLQPRFRALQEK